MSESYTLLPSQVILLRARECLLPILSNRAWSLDERSAAYIRRSAQSIRFLFTMRMPRSGNRQSPDPTPLSILRHTVREMGNYTFTPGRSTPIQK